MINKVATIFTVALAFSNVGCTQNRTYLTDKEKAWNPYSEGQVLVFATADGHTDTLEITRVEDMQFPDGIGAPRNERLRILAKLYDKEVSKSKIEVMLLYIYSKTPKYSTNIDFEIFLAGGGFWGKRYPIDELKSFNEFSLQTQNGIYDDVIRIDDNSNQPISEDDISTIFWSKSKGYVKCVKKNGIAWELVSDAKGH